LSACLIAEVCDYQACFRTVRGRRHSPLPETQSSEDWGGDAASPRPTSRKAPRARVPQVL